jgi:hypothetical protein
MPFSLSAYADGRLVSVATETAKEAFAKAVEWHVVHKLTEVSISEGSKAIRLAALHRQWRCRTLRTPSRPGVEPGLKAKGK